MNIITYNVRGLGRGVKWSTIRRLIKKESVDMMCIQETKKESIEKSMCQALIVGLIWGLIMSMDKKIVFRVLCFLIKKQ